MPHKQGMFITIEGTEGMGKSTVMKSLADFLSEKGLDFIITREPGGTEIAEKIRQVILSHYDEIMNPETELLLYFAGRIQHVQSVVLPAKAAGKIVISDRFTDASYAYQGGGRSIALEKIRLLEQHFINDLQPDLTLLLDAPINIGLERIAMRGAKDRIEKEELSFFERVRAIYHQRAKDYPNRFRLIDASQSVAEVEQAVRRIIESVFVLV
jgi:dTMP kinase